MTGKEILMSALRGEETPRPAWLPFVGCHGGHLIGATATEYLKSADLMVEGLKKAKELYKPDGLPIAFDLQLEAEILGCNLRWADDSPPAVFSHPLAEGKSLDDLPSLSAGQGRFPAVVEALQRLKAEIGDDTALYGLVCGPFTLALHLMGSGIFLEMFDNAERVKQVIDHCADLSIQAANIYLDNGADVIGVVDPMNSQISPEHFEEFVVGPLNKTFDAIRERGALSSIFVCGDVTRNLELMCRTSADSISVDEQIDMANLRELALANGKSFGGNIKLTTALLLGDEDDSKMEAIQVMDQCGTKGFVLAPGCDLPFDTPAANIQAVSLMVHDDYLRDAARETLQAKAGDSFDDIVMPDYENSEEVIIDVITLDSLACAPCQYMMDAAHKAAETASVSCRIVEHKIKQREGIGAMVKLGVSNLPTICINGTPRFESLIPGHDTLVEALEAAAK
jgi:MtaA/CmuA family methyltransferase